jgi:hypothetical protein
VRVHRAFRRAHDGRNIRKADIHLAFEFSRLDVLRVTGNLGGESAFTAAAKFQLFRPFVILRMPGMIHNAANQSLPISIDQSGPDSIL